MAIVLTVNGTSYEFPENNDDPNWAQDVTAWAEAVSDSVTDLLAASDLIVGSESINNNAAVAVSLTDLVFSPSTIRGAHISYTVYRASTDQISGNIETGIIYLMYDTDADPGSKWIMGQTRIGNAGILFSVTDFGQVQYTTTDIDSIGYVGKITYSVKLFTQ